jgi:hypothetical protein
VSAADEFAAMLSGLSATFGKRAAYLDPSSPQYDRDYAAFVRQRDTEEQLRKLGISGQKELLDHAATRTNVPVSVVNGAVTNSASLVKLHLPPLQQWAANGANFAIARTEFMTRALCDAGKIFEAATGPGLGNFTPQLITLRVQIIPAFSTRITILADTQKAHWILDQATRSFLQGITQKATNDLSLAEQAALKAAQQTLAASAGIARALRDDIKFRNKPVDLPLPGDIVINRVFGSVFYNRQTGFLRGSFGGRIEFPDLQNAFFEVTQATIDNGLNFSIAANTRGPLPFPGVTLTASVNATGGPPSVLSSFTGTGTITVTNGPTFAATVSYQQTNHSLSFDAQGGNLQSLRFTDNLVLFNAGFGFTLRPDAQAGELRANGSAGFFAKGTLPGTNAPLSRTNFHLFATNVQAFLAYQPGRVDLAFSNGTLYLPTFFYPTNIAALCPGGGPATGPTISLNPANPIRATFFDGSPPSVSFSGELDFRQFAFETPEFPGLAAAICSAQLKFSNTNLPYLTNVSASLQIPIPKQTNYVDLTNGVFTLTGYPSGRIQLRNDLTMLDLNGFKFILLGQTNPACGFGSGLTVYPSSGFSELPSFRLDGGLRVIAPIAMLTSVSNDTATGLACGSLSVTNGQLPDLQVQTLQFGGTFHLGQGGPIVSNALISFQGLQNLFRLDESHQFIVQVDGSLQIPSGPAFILQNARFTFFDYQRLPRFSVQTLGINNENFTLLNYLPAKVTRGQITLLSPMAELPGALAPTNISIRISSEIRFPATGNPMLLGAVDDIVVEFDSNGIPHVKNIDGFEMGVGGLKLPPLREAGGRIRVGGLSAGITNPGAVYMVGRIGGSYQGYTLIGQMAANISGPLGYCLDVNAGSVGIPLGPTGILITGASGGESLINNNGDPCEFTSYFSKDANGNLVAPSAPTPPGIGMTWELFREVVERMEAQAETYARNVPGIQNPGLRPDPSSTANLPCPGDCPPPTVNIFCQPHPDSAQFPGKVIAKFSSIDEATLNKLGITEANIQALGNNLALIAGTAAHAIRTNMAALTPLPDPSLLGPQATTQLGAVITNTLNALETSFSNLCFQALGSPQAGETYYTTIRRLAHEGLPCPDITMSVSGSVSYSGISSVAYVNGKAVLSTAGAGGVIGTVYVLGVPLGQGRVFIAITDAQGNPNPSLCGEVVVAFGPLDIGNVRVSYSCPGCVTGVLEGLPEILTSLSDAVLNQITAQVAPEIAARNLGRVQLIAALLALPNTQKVAIFAQLANQPASALPPNLPQIFFQGLGNAYDAINPILVACGEVRPKIFGFPLGDSLVAARFFATKTEEAGAFDFSPSLLLGAYGPILPIGDKASLSFAYSVTDPYAFVFGGLAGGFAPSNAVAYTQSAIDSMLQNTAFGISYEIHPFGLEMFNAAGRIILPDLTTHPVLPWSTWVRPEDRGNTNLPSRHDLLLTALAAHVLGDAVNWRGTTNDLATIYPAGSPQRAALTGLSLSKDYFPHGGVLGAASVTMPAVITDAPPFDKINLVLDQNANPLDRLTTAMDVIQNYILRVNTNGALAFYMPAPNPPAFYDTNGLLLGQAQLQSIFAGMHPQDVLSSIRSFDIANIQRGDFYPYNQAFIRGYLDGQLLGVPILDADILGLPADTNRTEAFLSITAKIPDGSWLKNFIPQADLVFDMRGVPPQPIEKRFATLLAQMQAARDTNANQATLMQLADSAILALTGDMPKTRLTADLVVGLQMPSPISDLLTFSNNTHLHAFSLRYDPAYQTNNFGPLARVRREGGIAFEGSMFLRVNGATIANIPTAELAVEPKGSGVPAMSGMFDLATLNLPGLQMNNVKLDFATDPNPHFSAAGSLAGLAVNSFLIQPLSGGTLTGRVDVARTGPGTASVGALLSAAQLRLPSLYGDTILIHGATRTAPFTFSTTGPWNATVELTNGITLGAGGTNLVQLGAGGLLGPITFSGNGTNSGSFTVGFGPAASLTLFPGNATLQRTVILAAGVNGSLTVNSDGTFVLTAQLGGSGLSFNGISAPAGASLRVTNTGVILTWQAGGANASLSVAPSGNTGFSGGAEIPPLNFGIFKLSGTNGGNLSGAFNNDGFAVNSGATLTLLADWLNNQSLTLSSFTASNNGGIHVAVSTPGQSLLFAGYPFDLTSFTFDRAPTNAGGMATLGLAGTLRTSPNFVGFPSLTFTGSVSSAGAVSLQTSASNANFFGYPVQNLTNTFTQIATQFVANLSTAFRLGTNSPPLWDKVGSNWFTGSLNADGSFALMADAPAFGLGSFSLNNVLLRFTRNAGLPAAASVEGDLVLPGFASIRMGGGINTNGSIYILPLAPAPSVPLPYANLNSQMSLVLTNNGLLVSGQLNQSPLPSLIVTGAVFNTGAFSLTGGVASASIGGFPFNNAVVRVDRTPGAGGVSRVSADGDVPVPGYGTLRFSGSLTNDGTFLVTNSITAPTLAGLPVPSMTGQATFRLTQSGLTLTGTLSTGAGSVLQTVLPTGSVTGIVSIASSGAQTLAANATISPITNGMFIIRPASGANFAATLDNAGLHLPPGGVLTYSNYFSAPLPLPEIIIQSNGNFMATVGNPTRASFSLRNFSLENVRFTLQRAANAISVQGLLGTLNLPGLNTAASVGGSWSNNGTYAITGSVASAVSLSGLPVTSLAAGASVAFNETTLNVLGNLSGSIFSWLPGASVGGTLTLTAPPSPTVTLSGIVSVPSLALGSFTIRRSDSAPIQATWNNSGVVFPATQNLELYFNGSKVNTSGLLQFTVPPNGDFSVFVFTTGFPLNGFNFTSPSCSFSRSAGVSTLNISGGLLSVPGFTSSLNASIGGFARNDGTVHVTNVFAVSGSFTPLNSGVTFGTLNAIASVTLDQNLVQISGSLSGRSLTHVLGVGSVGGSLAIDSLGSITPSATVTFPEVLLADNIFGFRIAPIGGGNFSATLSTSGVTLPAGAQVFYQGASLGAWSLPTFTIPNSGDFTANFGPVGLALNGYNLSCSGSLNRTAGVTKLFVNSGSSLVLPGLNASVNVSGTITNNGSYLISGTTSGSIGLANLPITTLGSGANAALARSGGATTLRLAGTVSGGVLGTGSGASDIQLANSVATVSIGTDGSLGLSASVSVLPFSAGFFTIESTSGGNIGATLDNNYLTLTNARLRVTLAGLLNQNVTLNPIQIPASGIFDLPVSLSNLGVKGFPFSGVTFNLKRFLPSGGVRDLRMTSFAGNLNLSGFGQHFQGGTINSDGSLAVDWFGSLTLGGFTAGSGYLNLRSSGMSAGGTFNLSAAGRTFNSSVAFAGSVLTSGSYSLTGNASLRIGGFDTLSAGFTFANGTISGSPTLTYGDSDGHIELPTTSFSLTSAGISFSASKTDDTQWRSIPGCGGGCSARARWTVTINNSNTAGDYSANVSGTGYGYIGPSPPGDPDSLPSNQKKTIGTGINSSGQFSVTFPFAIWPCGNSVTFELWPTPKVLSCFNF